VGSVKVALPQRINDDDSPEARAFVYHCAVSALEASKNLEPIPKIQALCSTMGLDTVGSFCIRQFQKGTDEMINNPANFDVLSYHGPDGASIADTTVVPGSRVLKPTGDATTPTAANTRRKKNISYARIRCVLDCQGFLPAPALCDPVRMEAEFYVGLPQDTRAVMNTAGNLEEITTFYGVDNIGTLSAEEYKAQITSRTGQCTCWDISKPAYGTTTATVDKSKHHESIMADVLDKGCWQVVKS
jgi:hypothetical protein